MINCFFRSVIVTSFAALAAGADIEASLLERAGERVQQFWEELSSVNCTESVVQEKLNDKGKTVLRNQANYDYLISMRWNAGELLVDESRVAGNQTQKKAPEGVLLTTRGFATMLLILHPDFQPSYHFEIQALEEIDGRKLTRVAFVPRNGAKSSGALELKGREYPIAWEGAAWIDPASGMVARIQAHWKEPAEEIGLALLASDVRYAPVPLRSRVYWLPLSAEIEVKSRHQHWRNLHQFANYKLFSVETETKIGEKKQ